MRRKMWITLAAIVAFLLMLGCIGYFYGSRHFVVHDRTLYFDNLPDSFDGYRIAQFSDFHAMSFHMGHEEDVRTVVDLVNSQHCDLIVFTGDLVTIQSGELDGFDSCLASLSAPDGVMSIMGNHDYALYQRGLTPGQRREDVRKLQRRQRDMGWQLLLNDHRIIRRGGDSIAVVGVENDGEAPRFPSYGNLPKAMSGIGDGTFTVLLSHDPTHWRRKVIPDTDIELTLSGHTHAGQFKVFGWSPVSWVYKEWSGRYGNEKTDKTGRSVRQTLVVSEGVGCVPVPFRVGAWPEVNVITLRKSK